VAGGSGDLRPRTADHRSANVTRIPCAGRRAISLGSARTLVTKGDQRCQRRSD
jgi:hypothetical protein